MNKITRPVLRWHGGKWRLAPWVISQFPDHRVYVEPFGGAASVLLRKDRCYAEVYNDLDSEVVNLFRVLRGPDVEALCESLKLTPFCDQEYFASYDEAACPVENARRFIIRSFMGFGSNSCQRKSGFRSNSNRSGTTPAREWLNYPEQIPRIAERLRGVTVLSRQAIDVMECHDGPETLHYVDPPYLPETRDAGSDYAHEMSAQEHVELLGFLRSLSGRVVVSGYPSETYDTALSGWRRIQRDALADGARARTEVLWMNFDAGMPLFEGRM